jgi:hypothetical protein
MYFMSEYTVQLSKFKHIKQTVLSIKDLEITKQTEM